MIKRLSVVGLSVFALAGLFSAPASAAGAGACVTVHLAANGSDVVNQAVCTP